MHVLVYPFTSWQMFGLFQFLAFPSEPAVNISVLVFLRGCRFSWVFIQDK